MGAVLVMSCLTVCLTDRLPACRPTMLLCGGGWCLGWRSGGAREAPVLFIFLVIALALALVLTLTLALKSKKTWLCVTHSLCFAGTLFIFSLSISVNAVAATLAPKDFFIFFFFPKKKIPTTSPVNLMPQVRVNSWATWVFIYYSANRAKTVLLHSYLAMIASPVASASASHDYRRISTASGSRWPITASHRRLSYLFAVAGLTAQQQQASIPYLRVSPCPDRP